MNTPLNRTILLLDIERYSDRDDIEQAFLRRMLYDIADQTLDAAGIGSPQRLRADRGDSVMELIDANAPVSVLLRTLLTEVPVQLRRTNRLAASSAQIRLRAVLATGYVAVDAHDGWVGSDLNHACRLLDATLLRNALRERPDDFALCVSDSVHQGIVRHGHPGIRPEDFHHIAPESKNGRLSAWLYGPVPAPGTDRRRGTESGVRTPESDTSGEEDTKAAAKPVELRIPGTTHIAGNQYGVAGGANQGDFTFSFDQRAGKEQT
ncbi:hypothetical protein OG875_11705 [Streptomyces sp. NBC_01498]|uniref:hypothetical protein n=1 Tax=Streptomyces sp. NBC_01498 TaxID=2975870 RepID=UPI002E7BF945|nr:hypothetical protein [Streptomyces sp. NBC_01498]WTL25199.1 hypothetical protein OG875_11705 [Streptomyces sp. NBC_01498]